MSKDGRVVVTAENIDHDRESTWRKTWVIVVVLLLALFSITWLFTRPIFEPDDDPEAEPYPWESPTEPLLISEDTTWKEQTIKMDTPVVIEEGATLRIEGIEVQVDLLDLVFWQRPAFRVRDGGALEVVNSQIVIKEEQLVSATVVGNIWLDESYVPNLARLVNLGNATQPYIGFNYTSLFGPVPIAIGILPEDGSDLVVVSAYEPTEADVGEWEFVMVDLTDYAGSRPRVVIFPSTYPEGLMVISDIRAVELWDEDLKGDWYPTGNAKGDGWELEGFTDLGWIMESHLNGSHYSRGLGDLWKGLIEADGSVTLTGSDITGPKDLPRRGARERVKESLEDDPAYQILGTATRGGHIFVNDDLLTMRDSTISHVPVLCNGTFVDVSDTTFKGDGDLLTLNASRGTIEGAEFVGVEPLPGHPFRDADMRHRWGLGIEGALEGYWTEVLNCTFTGCEQAIDLSHATVKVAGCEFNSIERLTIWDHFSHLYGFDGGSYDSFEEIMSTNEFIDCEQYLYLRTTTTYIFFEVPPESEQDIEVTGVHSRISRMPLYGPPDWHFISHEDKEAIVMTPDVLVDSNGRVFHEDVHWISVANTDVGFDLPISIDEAMIIVDLTADHPHRPQQEESVELYYVKKDPDDAFGEFEAALEVVPGAYPDHDITLVYDLDGEQVGEIVLPGPYYTLGSHYEIITLFFKPGLHELNVSLMGVLKDDPDGEVFELYSTTFVIIRLEGDERDLDPWMLFEMDGILVESGNYIHLGVLEPRGTELDLTLAFTGLGRSLITIEGLILPKGSELQLHLDSGFDLELSNASLNDIYIENIYRFVGDEQHLPMITIDNMECESLSMTVAAIVRLMNVTSNYHTSLSVYSSREVTVSGCQFSKWGARIEANATAIRVEECTVSSDRGSGVVIRIEGGEYTYVYDCDFNGAYLAIMRPPELFDLTTQVQVFGCTFQGDGAICYLGFDFLAMTAYDIDPDFVPPIIGEIYNNVFQGSEAGLVLHHGLYDELYKANTLEDDARLFAFYVLTFRTMDTLGTPPRPEFWIIPTEDVVVDPLFPDRRYLILEGEMLLDVTDDPSSESDPPDVAVILLSGYAPDSKVGGFAAINPLVDAGEIILTTRVPFEELLLEHVKEWPG